MRELPLLASLGLAVVLGFGAGYLFSPRAEVAPSTSNPPAVTPSDPATPATPLTPVTHIVATDPSEDPPAVVEQWNGSEKEVALRRVERLSQTEAEYLCFTLALIPRDEVFDKVNVKGRLVRYINSLTGPSDFRDFDNALRQMAMR